MIDGRMAVRAIAVCAVALAGISVGYIEGQRATGGPESVRVIYEESGEVSRIETDSSDPIIYTEHWRGNDAAADGLYDADPLTAEED